jgi:hypothetical protein
LCFSGIVSWGLRSQWGPTTYFCAGSRNVLS